MTEPRQGAPADVTAPVFGQGFEIWPHPYQVDHSLPGGWSGPSLTTAYRPLRSAPVRPCSLLLVSAVGVRHQPVA